MSDRSRATYALSVLFAINAMNFFDRQIGGALAEPIRKEWGLSDSALGASKLNAHVAWEDEP